MHRFLFLQRCLNLTNTLINVFRHGPRGGRWVGGYQRVDQIMVFVRQAAGAEPAAHDTQRRPKAEPQPVNRCGHNWGIGAVIHQRVKPVIVSKVSADIAQIDCRVEVIISSLYRIKR